MKRLGSSLSIRRAGVSTRLFSTLAIDLAGGVSEGLDSLSISWAGVPTS